MRRLRHGVAGPRPGVSGVGKRTNRLQARMFPATGSASRCGNPRWRRPGWDPRPVPRTRATPTPPGCWLDLADAVNVAFAAQFHTSAVLTRTAETSAPSTPSPTTRPATCACPSSDRGRWCRCTNPTIPRSIPATSHNAPARRNDHTWLRSETASSRPPPPGDPAAVVPHVANTGMTEVLGTDGKSYVLVRERSGIRHADRASAARRRGRAATCRPRECVVRAIR